jgi:dTDP-4-dehydrorhamnose reductase
VDIEDFDITDEVAVMEYIAGYAPGAVIHCSAWTAVDQAEGDASACRRVNEFGTKNIALACKAANAKMMYFSTDYVFPGEGEHFYEPDDATDPLNVYGSTKLGGEIWVRNILEKYFILRISWVFGKNGNNFVKTMLRLSETLGELNVVCDQIGSPTYTVDIAKLACDMIGTDKYGVYHATNEGFCSWAEFAEEIFKLTDKKIKVNHVTTAEYGAKAPRPLNSRMSKRKLYEAGFDCIPTWRDALVRYLQDMGY